jgi:hypothetical protein
MASIKNYFTELKQSLRTKGQILVEITNAKPTFSIVKVFFRPKKPLFLLKRCLYSVHTFYLDLAHMLLWTSNAISLGKVIYNLKLNVLRKKKKKKIETKVVFQYCS